MYIQMYTIHTRCIQNIRRRPGGGSPARPQAAGPGPARAARGRAGLPPGSLYIAISCIHPCLVYFLVYFLLHVFGGPSPCSALILVTSSIVPTQALFEYPYKYNIYLCIHIYVRLRSTCTRPVLPRFLRGTQG